MKVWARGCRLVSWIYNNNRNGATRCAVYHPWDEDSAPWDTYTVLLFGRSCVKRKSRQNFSKRYLPHNKSECTRTMALLDSGVLCNASWIIWPIECCSWWAYDEGWCTGGRWRLWRGYRWSDGMPPMVSKSWESTNDSFPPLLSQLYPTHFADLNRSFHPMFFFVAA